MFYKYHQCITKIITTMMLNIDTRDPLSVLDSPSQCTPTCDLPIYHIATMRDPTLLLYRGASLLAGHNTGLPILSAIG